MDRSVILNRRGYCLAWLALVSGPIAMAAFHVLAPFGGTADIGGIDFEVEWLGHDRGEVYRALLLYGAVPIYLLWLVFSICMLRGHQWARWFLAVSYILCVARMLPVWPFVFQSIITFRGLGIVTTLFFVNAWVLVFCESVGDFMVSRRAAEEGEDWDSSAVSADDNRQKAWNLTKEEVARIVRYHKSMSRRARLAILSG